MEVICQFHACTDLLIVWLECVDCVIRVWHCVVTVWLLWYMSSVLLESEAEDDPLAGHLAWDLLLKLLFKFNCYVVLSYPSVLSFVCCLTHFLLFRYIQLLQQYTVYQHLLCSLLYTQSINTFFVPYLVPYSTHSLSTPSLFLTNSLPPLNNFSHFGSFS